MTDARSGSFLRVLGLCFGLAVTFGNTIGTGILNGPGIVAQQLPGTLPFLGVWVAVGLGALLAAPSLAELAAMMPRAGGYYVYAKRAFGGFPAFVVGWTDWLVSCGGIAAAAVAFGTYANDVMPAFTSWGPLVPLTMVGVLTLVQLRGIESGSRVQEVISAATGALFVAFLVACFMAPAGTGAASVAPAKSIPIVPALGTAFLTVLFAYDGWDGFLYFGEEVENPGRDIPRSMFIGIAALMVLYVLVNLALIHVLTMRTLAARQNAVQAATVALFGSTGGHVASVAMMIVFAGVASACLLIGTRVIAALGAAGDLPRAFARVGRGGTPVPALVMTAMATGLFILLGQTIGRLMDVVGLFVLVTGVLTLSAVVILRRREPRAHRPYKAWGYPATTLLTLVVSVAIIAANAWTDPRHTTYALLVLAASYPAYRLRAKS